jgi:hypothetical protein
MLHVTDHVGKTPMSLPTADDFNNFNSLDEKTASKHFLNKTLTEAQALFRENSLTYCQDFMWMAPRAFNFYLEALFNYLKSDDSTGDNDIVNCLPSVVEYRWDDEEFSSAADRVRMMIDYVIANYGKFQVDHTIYGDLLEKHKTLRDELRKKSDDNHPPPV